MAKKIYNRNASVQDKRTVRKEGFLTQADILKQIKTLEREISDTKKKLNEDVRLRKLRVKAEAIKDSYFTVIEVKRDKIIALKRALKEEKLKKELKIPDCLSSWLFEYKRGVDWGYGGLVIVWISDDGRYVIVTNKGTVTGTGTAMGSGGYYYAKAEHWAVDTKCMVTYHAHSSKIADLVVKGRLTKAKKQQLLDAIDEYKKNVSQRKVATSLARQKNA